MMLELDYNSYDVPQDGFEHPVFYVAVEPLHQDTQNNEEILIYVRGLYVTTKSLGEIPESSQILKHLLLENDCLVYNKEPLVFIELTGRRGKPTQHLWRIEGEGENMKTNYFRIAPELVKELETHFDAYNLLQRPEYFNRVLNLRHQESL